MTTSSDDPELGELGTLLGYHLRRATVAMHRGFATELGLTEQQFATLSLIRHNPGIVQAEIGQQLNIDRSTTMELVRRLEHRGLLSRRRSPVDARQLELGLTDRGVRTIDHALALVAEHDRSFTSRFADAELQSLFDALRRIYDGESSGKCLEISPIAGGAPPRTS